MSRTEHYEIYYKTINYMLDMYDFAFDKNEELNIRSFVFRKIIEILNEAIEYEGVEVWFTLIAPLYLRCSDYIKREKSGKYNDFDKKSLAIFMEAVITTKKWAKNILINNPTIKIDYPTVIEARAQILLDDA